MTENTEAFLEQYEKEQLADYELPETIKTPYDIISCLKYSKEKKTLLLREKASGRKCILKIGSGKAKDYLLSEDRILDELNKKGIPNIPKPYMLLEDSTKAYLLREYMEGHTPVDIVERKGGYSEQELIELGCKLCDTVLLLHTMDEPVIHRDIKPENIIITPEGEVTLIDFETLRVFSVKKDSDTVFMGTSTTAAPEQYGFAQTDTRTDIYAMGMTMLYLACGSYDKEELQKTEYSAKTRRIIQKCCSFDPAGRYRNAAELKKALISCRETVKRKRRMLCMAGVMAGFLLLFYGYYFAALYKESMAAANESKKVEFTNALLEQEVRSELGFDNSKPVTYRDLKNVHRIALIGSEEVARNADFTYRNGAYIGDESTQKTGNGEITDLSLLSSMPELYEIILCQQNISDIGPLKELPVTNLVLADNKIADLSPLEEMTNLEELYIGNNPATDLSVLEKCKGLKKLNIDSMTVNNIDFLKELSLNSLSVCFLRLTQGNWDPIASQKELKHFYTADLDREQAAAVNQLTGLNEFASWWNSKLTDLNQLKGLKNLQILIILDGFQSLDGIDAMQKLKELFIGYNDIHDISLIEKLPNLEVLGLDHTEVADFSALFKCPSLTKVRQVTGKQKQEILKINAKPEFDILNN